MYTLLGFIGLGHWEILIVAGIVLLLFGNRLPNVMRSVGRSIVEFKKGVQGIEDKADQDVATTTPAENKEQEVVR